MSKKAKARRKQKKLTAKAQSRNHQRHTKYAQHSTVTATPPSTNGNSEHAGKTKGRFSKTGHTKAQKKRLALGKPAEGHAASYGSRTTRSTFGSTTTHSAWWY